MRRNTRSTTRTASTNKPSPHLAVPNPVPSTGGVLTAFAVVSAVVLTVMVPTAMVAAAITVVGVAAVGRTVHRRRPSPISVPGTADGVAVSSSTETDAVCD